MIPLQQIENKKSANFKGYSRILSGAGVRQEAFAFGFEPMEDATNTSDGSSDGVMAGANVWPSGKPAFREAALSY